MATFDIPTPPQGVAKWQTRAEFDAGTEQARFHRILYKWNVRDASWYFDFADDTGIALVRSRRIVLATDILRDFKHRQIPQGSIDIIDTSGEHIEPTILDLGDRVLVRYTELE